MRPPSRAHHVRIWRVTTLRHRNAQRSGTALRRETVDIEMGSIEKTDERRPGDEGRAQRPEEPAGPVASHNQERRAGISGQLDDDTDEPQGQEERNVESRRSELFRKQP